VTDLSVVIVSWNVREHLRACLESLKTSLPLSSEVIVVDNASRDGSARMVLEQYGYVRLIKNQRNVGFAAAANQGVERARGAYVLFLAPDCQVVGGALKQMHAFLEANVRYGAVAPRLVDADLTTQRSHAGLPRLATLACWGTPYERWFPANREVRRLQAAAFDYSRDGDVEQASLSCLMMRRKALKKQKPLDEQLWLWFNDADLCRRLSAAGWRIGYLASSVVVHHAQASVRQLEDGVPEWHKDRLRYYRKHHGRLGAACVKASLAWTVADHAVAEFWRRAHGAEELSLRPAWQTLTAVLRA
jgi:GT2 family glycosyltransferase